MTKARFGAGILVVMLLFVLHFWLPPQVFLGFWLRMSLIIILCLVLFKSLGDDLIFRLCSSASILKQIAWGLGSAMILYLIFWAGHQVITSLTQTAAVQINKVYAYKIGHLPLTMALLLSFVIGPGEELLWRGIVQHHLQKMTSPLWALACSSGLYSLVHCATQNPMLILAAAIGGLYWGLLYQQTRSLLTCMISHTLWDLAIFIVIPLA